MNTLQKDIRSIRGIGEKRAQALGKLGVFSLFDLISYFPRRYEDRSRVKRWSRTARASASLPSAVMSRVSAVSAAGWKSCAFTPLTAAPG